MLMSLILLQMQPGISTRSRQSSIIMVRTIVILYADTNICSSQLFHDLLTIPYNETIPFTQRDSCYVM